MEGARCSVFLVPSVGISGVEQCNCLVPSIGGGDRHGNYIRFRAKKGPAKNADYEDIPYIIIIIKNLPLGPSKT